MRMVLEVSFPHEPFNAEVLNGTAGETLGKILEANRPESVIFTEENGKRGAILVIDVKKPSDIPAFAEPWFLKFNADCHFRIAMTPEDLQQAGLDEIAKQWS